MALIDIEYINLLEDIKFNGLEYVDETRGVKRKQIPTYNFDYKFNEGSFPALTLKKLAFKQVVTELIWFLSGDRNIKYLKDNGCNIWNKDAENYNGFGEGDIGFGYGYQWRSFGGWTDQITKLCMGMISNIMSTNLIVSAWNPNQMLQTALPPCHNFFQIIGEPLKDGSYGFTLSFNMRSVDVFLGLPFNIASYALLSRILEVITGHKALGIQGNLHCVHLYENSYESADIIISQRKAHQYCAPKLQIPSSFDLSDMKSIDLSQFKLINYKSYPAIKVDMLSKIN